MATTELILEDKLTRNVALVLIIAIGIAYMGWLVVTYMEQRETGAYIRNRIDEFMDAFEARTTVQAEVVKDEPSDS